VEVDNGNEESFLLLISLTFFFVVVFVF